MFPPRRESLSPAPTSGSSETEKRAPRRLSKPRTNKSSGNPRLKALHLEDKIKSNSTSNLPLSPRPTPHQPRALMRSQIFGKDVEPRATKSLTSETSGWKGIALMIKNIEARQSAENVNAMENGNGPEKKARRPFSAIFGSRRPSSTSVQTRSDNSSRDGLSSHHQSNSAATVESGTSKEDISDLTPTRFERRSSYTPGVATRQGKPQNRDTSVPELLGPLDESGNEVRDSPRPSLDEWIPPPRITRTETPSDLEATYIGGLRLGSLQIMNGRASPAPSGLSKQILLKSVHTAGRDVSSDYGGGDEEISTVTNSQHSADDVNERISRPVLDTSLVDTSNKGVEAMRTATLDVPPSSPAELHTPKQSPIPKRKPVPRQDHTSDMARQYMAEMPDSPYSPKPMSSPPGRSSSPVGSVIITTSKANEYDDCLFEDEAMAASICSDADKATIESFYSVTDSGSVQDELFQSTVEFQRQMSPAKLRPPEPTIPEAHDSGYSSNASLQDDVSEEGGIKKFTPVYGNPYQGSQVQRESLPAKKGPKAPARPLSILKQRWPTVPELPTFNNLHPIVSPAASAVTLPNPVIISSPDPSIKTPRKGRKLQKRRPLSQPIPVELITVQGAHRTVDSAIPPVPAEILHNLAIRNRELPELQQTYNSMDHTKRQSMSTLSFAMPDIRFPSPVPDSGDPRSQRPSWTRRSSWRGRINMDRTSFNRRNLDGCSQSEAMEIINGLNRAISGVAANPYDAVHVDMPRSPPKGRPRPRSMMDDQTAAEFARLRSRVAFEREMESNRHRDRFFNDRGGIPGRNLRPTSMESDAPPVPPLPTRGQFNERSQQSFSQATPVIDNHGYNHGQPHYPSHSGFIEEPAPVPPRHSPRPRYVEPTVNNEQGFFAPPPPSHSPRPITTAAADSWESQWVPGREWQPQGAAVNNLLYGSHNTRNDVRGRQLNHGQSFEEGLYPEIPLRQPRENHSPRRSGYLPYRPSGLPSGYDLYDEDLGSHRPLPTPAGHSYWVANGERSASGVSQVGQVASLAESLHPAQVERHQPPPQFGRYSGGLKYEYEKGAGFGGSAGTRSVSGKAEAMRRGVALRASHGVDLGDVPMVAGLHRM